MAPETQALVKKMMIQDDCQTQNEFIEKAIRFYAGYVSSQEATEYLPVALVSALRDTIDNSENRTARLLFKLAVEMDMMMNVLAVQMNVPEDDLAKLRNMCVRHVKETKGSRDVRTVWCEGGASRGQPVSSGVILSRPGSCESRPSGSKPPPR